MPAQPRRSQASRDAILRACVQLVRDPSARVSIEAIARVAGVGKQTIYRWWPSIGAVLVEAVARERGQWPTEVPHTDDVYADLRVMISSVATMMADPERAPVLTAIVAEMQRDPQVRTAFEDSAFRPIRDRNRARLQPARAAGQLVSPLDNDDLLDLVLCPLWFRLLTRPGAVTPGFASAAVDVLERACSPTWRPVAGPPG